MIRFARHTSALFTRVLAAFALLLAFALPASAGSVNLAWDPVASPLVAGYMIHYGPAAGSYTASLDAGNVTAATIPNLTEGSTYHFVVAAYNSAHAEGAPSNDVAAVIQFAVPVANFTASTVSGPAPLGLNFINSSTGSITAYAWTFGDGTTSTVANPAKVYSSPGNYTVALTVTGPGGSNTRTKPSYITVTGSSDTTPPTAPAGLSATPTSSTAINLSWSAATDNVGVTGYRVERCQGASCTTFTQIATSTATTYSNSGLAAGTTYRYRVRATDTAGNLGAYSAIATATTSAAPDTTPPTAPASLTATATSSSAINLAWTAATDNVGVTGYRVERCQGATCTTFAQIATPTGTTYSNSGLAAGTTYRYRVRATDAAGNLGAYSTIASATTSSGLDTTPPTAPASLTATAVGSTATSLTWTAATDNVAVTGYKVERCLGASCTTFAQIGTSTGTSYSNSGLAASTTYRYRVRATDAAGNLGPYSAIAAATTSAAGVWVEDAVPAGATLAGTEGWSWVSSNPAPYSGSLAHQSALQSGLHQHYFYNATTTLSVAAGDTLFAYVYLDPANPPQEVMLQWNDGTWEHRAYWGANLIGWGTDGTVSRRYMGPLPAAGQWALLAVPASQVGLEGHTLNGMAYTLYDGRATWDYAGKLSATVWLDDAAPAGATLAGTGEGWSWVSSNPAPFSGARAHQSALLSGLHQHYFYNATSTLSVAVGDTLFAYVYLDPANPPSEVMLQWNDGNWEHRAYWGANLIAWGTDGTVSRRYMGPLPAAGQWVRLAVPASQVGLEGRTLNAMAYTLYDGRATWDYAGSTN